MSDYLQLDEYLAALDEATHLIALRPAPASPDDERLDVLLHRIAAFPPAYIGLAQSPGDAGSGAMVGQLRAEIEASLFKQGERQEGSPSPIHKHGVGRTL